MTPFGSELALHLVYQISFRIPNSALVSINRSSFLRTSLPSTSVSTLSTQVLVLMLIIFPSGDPLNNRVLNGTFDINLTNWIDGDSLTGISKWVDGKMSLAAGNEGVAAREQLITAPTPSPSASPSESPSASPSISPSASPSLSLSPSVSPSASPSIDTMDRNKYVIHCFRCGIIYLEDPDFCGRCPNCGYRRSVEKG
jgi:hypothetical protein